MIVDIFMAAWAKAEKENKRLEGKSQKFINQSSSPNRRRLPQSTTSKDAREIFAITRETISLGKQKERKTRSQERVKTRTVDSAILDEYQSIGALFVTWLVSTPQQFVLVPQLFTPRP